MEKLKTLLDKLLSIVCIILFGFLVVLVTWQVITRFVFNEPSVISEELAKYCFVWLVLFGAALVFGEKGHMAIEFIQSKFSPKIKLVSQVFIEIIIISFASFVLIIGGSKATSLAWLQMSAALQIPVGYLYASMPISGVCIIFYCLYHIYSVFNKRAAID